MSERPAAYHDFVGDTWTDRRCGECNLLPEEHNPLVIIEYGNGYVLDAYQGTGFTDMDILHIDYDELRRDDPEVGIRYIESLIERFRILRQEDANIERTVQRLLALRNDRIEEMQ